MARFTGRPLLPFLLFAGLLLWAAGSPAARAQEFDCNVNLNDDQVEGTGLDYLSDLQTSIEEYMNKQIWTDDRFLEHERIECSLTIFIQQAITMTRFQGSLQLGLRRPIYGATQNTTVVLINDEDWVFDYAQGTPLIRDLEQYTPLTSILDFYAYVMLGYDYDTFSELGGTEHFQRARRIADIAQAQGASGWTTIGGDRSRSELITQLLDPRFQPLRQAYFRYHFGVLDHFAIEPEVARATAMEVLTSIEAVYENVARQYTIDLFFNTKAASKELVGIFEDSSLSTAAYTLLTQLDPSNLGTYTPLVQ